VAVLMAVGVLGHVTTPVEAMLSRDTAGAG
jgi:hypothetical protein